VGRLTADGGQLWSGDSMIRRDTVGAPMRPAAPWAAGRVPSMMGVPASDSETVNTEMITERARPAVTATVPMSGQEEWRRTLRVRERFLADPRHLPPADCGVRREIIMSWRRSLLSGVDTAATDLPCDTGAAPPYRLVQAAQPVLDRLAGEIAGTQSWTFLADRECRLVSFVVGDQALAPMLEDRGAFPGACFGEDRVGTNGLGTAVEQQRPFIVAGSEHFRAYESDATTCGAPIRDPLTGRLAGLLNMNCPYRLASPLMLPFVTGLAREIEIRLLAAYPASDQPLLDEVGRMWKRRSQAVVVLSEEVFVANAAALALLGGDANHELLRDWACEAAARGRECAERLELGPGLVVTARCRPVSGTARHFSAVVTLTATETTARRRAPRSSLSPAERLAGQLARARAARVPVLLRGERGVGKTHAACRLHDSTEDSGQLTVADCALGGLDSAAWTERLRCALADSPATVVLQHLNALDDGLVAPVAALIASARAWLVATVTEPSGAQGALTERFDVVLHVPPLRDRAADIPALVAEIIGQLHRRPPRPRCTPEALSVLADSEWPGNVRQLRQVVTTALTRSMSCDITVDDLPAGYPGAPRGRRLTALERAEREALVAALRAANGDREAAARDLGISRATIYRKLKRFKISAPNAG
jgi:transcriptional regulator of acetoin/glycerol metabolism